MAPFPRPQQRTVCPRALCNGKEGTAGTAALCGLSRKARALFSCLRWVTKTRGSLPPAARKSQVAKGLLGQPGLWGHEWTPVPVKAGGDGGGAVWVPGGPRRGAFSGGPACPDTKRKAGVRARRRHLLITPRLISRTKQATAWVDVKTVLLGGTRSDLSILCVSEPPPA